MKAKTFYTDLRNTIIDRLNDYKNTDVYGSELAYTLFEGENANGSVLCNTYETKEFIKNHFDLFAEFSEYYKDNFGESLDIFAEPEKAHVILLLEAAQMVLSNLNTVDEFWNDSKELTQELINSIVEELNKLELTDEEIFNKPKALAKK